MGKRSMRALFLALLLLTLCLLSPDPVRAHSHLQDTTPTPAEVIEAVNALRMARGLLPLNVHPVLMQVAQWEANAIAGGAPGHTRPSGLTLGQWLISLGYPLAGDLSLDGYRSENWIAAGTAQGAVQAWLGDAPHTNTMLSPNRSDIGAGVAVGDQIYIVVETALQTNSGQMQSEAHDILTAIPQAASSDGTDNLVPQYIVPVKRSTARPEGEVFHKVQYGQSLWSIATTYNTTIDQIRAWNNLDESDSIYEGQTLLVQRSATQPPPPTATPKATLTAFLPATPTSALGSLTMTIPPDPTDPVMNDSPHAATPGGIWVGVIAVLSVAAAVIGTWMTRRAPAEFDEKAKR